MNTRLCSCVGICLAVSSASAAFEIDARIVPSDDFDIGTAIGDNRNWAQTFTASSAGSVDSIGLELVRNSNATQDVLFSLISLDAGEPTVLQDNLLFQSVIPLNSIPLNPNEPSIGPSPTVPLVSVDVSPAGLALSQGDGLAIVISSPEAVDDGSKFIMWFAGTETYPGGDAFSSLDGGTSWVAFKPNALQPERYDFGFTVNVIPSPSAVGLLASGLAFITRRRR